MDSHLHHVLGDKEGLGIDEFQDTFDLLAVGGFVHMVGWIESDVDGVVANEKVRGDVRLMDNSAIGVLDGVHEHSRLQCCLIQRCSGLAIIISRIEKMNIYLIIDRI